MTTDLSRIKYVLESAEQLGSLTSAGLGVDEDDEWSGIVEWCDLEGGGAGTIWRLSHSRIG